MERHTRLLEQFSKSKDLKKKEQTLFSARKEVNINAGGTSGYIVKHGPHKGKVLGHRIVKSNNNW
ncbi:hypothetical protein N9C33_03290 [Crocinitomicaceae bacterium]|nr:hypothetical protein [Crocinitomicaceae bacterium]